MAPFNPRSLTRRTLLRGAAALPVVAAAGPAAVLAQSTPPATPSQDASIPELVAGNTTFAFDLYAELRSSIPGNLLISPYSISEALAMTYAGARGETAEQMADALSFTLEQPALHAAFGALTADLVARGNAEADEDDTVDARSLQIANALWVEQTYPLAPAYPALLERYYGSALNQADFRNAPEETREEINTWVAEQTENRIEDIVRPGDITRFTKLVLVNAIYFYGPWRSTFDSADTRDDEFHRLDGMTVTVPFMVQQEYLGYAAGDGWQAVELPYEQEGFAMTILLPDDGTFDAVEAGLDAAILDAALGQLEVREIILHLPKFKPEFGTIDLKDTLRALGMVDAFNPYGPNQADFTGMVDMDALVQHGLQPPMIEYVLHRAFINVDEQGTEAVAVTGVGVTPVGASSYQPLELRIDRPFLLTIRDTVTGTLLFLGRVLDPSA